MGCDEGLYSHDITESDGHCTVCLGVISHPQFETEEQKKKKKTEIKNVAPVSVTRPRFTARPFVKPTFQTVSAECMILWKAVFQWFQRFQITP